MSLLYRLLYTLRVTPWERDSAVPELVETARGLQPGRALDLGCGTGAQAVHLARTGWEVTAVDVVPRALDTARRRADRAGVSVDFRRADVTRLEDLGLADVALAFDRGCFHGLPDQARDAYVRGVSAATRSGAILLLMAFQPPTPAAMPRGATQEELEKRLGPAWRLVSADASSEDATNTRIERARPVWYRFERV